MCDAPAALKAELTSREIPVLSPVSSAFTRGAVVSPSNPGLSISAEIPETWARLPASAMSPMPSVMAQNSPHSKNSIMTAKGLRGLLRHIKPADIARTEPEMPANMYI